MWHEKYIGKPYIFGAKGPDAYDCLTLILAIIDERYQIRPNLAPVLEDWAKMDTGRYLRESLRQGGLIANKDNVGDGHMVLFRLSGNFAEHAGYMIDRNRFIHILDDDFVRVDSLRRHPWDKRFFAAIDFRGKNG